MLNAQNLAWELVTLRPQVDPSEKGNSNHPRDDQSLAMSATLTPVLSIRGCGPLPEEVFGPRNIYYTPTRHDDGRRTLRAAGLNKKKVSIVLVTCVASRVDRRPGGVQWPILSRFVGASAPVTCRILHNCR